MQSVASKATAPGPDGLPSELYKWLDEENRTTLLGHLKKCWDTQALEDCMNDANLATIYKKDPQTGQKTTGQSLYSTSPTKS